MTAEPFRIVVPQATLDSIRSKLEFTRIGYAPDDDEDWHYGTDARYLATLIDYWREGYDWRAQEALLNRWPQFRARINGIDVHFYHIRGDERRPLPIILTHGWPGSIVEFQEAMPLLVAAGFTIVVPSLPGFGWSSRPKRPIGARTIAEMWRTLMVDVLGYQRFFAQGGDFGSLVSVQLGINHADVVPAIHLNFFMGPSPAHDAAPEVSAHWADVSRMMELEGAYIHAQACKPQTIGLALHDHPTGWAAWVIEKFRRWADTGGDIESRFSKDQLITNLMTYLVNDAIQSSMWIYYAASRDNTSPGPVPVPTAIARFPAEFYPLPNRTVAARQHNIVRWTEMKAGGHFAAMEEPIAFAEDVVAFFSAMA